MRYTLTALIAAAIGAAIALYASRPPSLAKRVKASTSSAVLQRKEAIVDCMAYTAAKMVGTEHGDRETDAACESLAEDFVSTLPAPSPPPKRAPAEGISL